MSSSVHPTEQIIEIFKHYTCQIGCSSLSDNTSIFRNVKQCARDVIKLYVTTLAPRSLLVFFVDLLQSSGLKTKGGVEDVHER